MTHDVLAHDDGIVDQQADGQRKREQRHRVDREVQRPHGKERRDDRHRQRQAGDDGRPPRIQEQVDDRDREDGAQHDGELHVVQRLADAARVVAREPKAHVLRQRPFDFGDDRLDAVCDRDRIGAGDLENLDGERRHVAEQRRRPTFGDGVDHATHVANTDRGTVAHRNDDLAESARVGDAPGHADAAFAVALADASGGDFLILAGKRGRDDIWRQPEAAQRHGDPVPRDSRLAAPLSVTPPTPSTARSADG